MLRRVLLPTLGTTLLIAAAVWVAILGWPLHNPHPPLSLPHGTLAIRDATVYTSPDDPPLLHASILIRDGRIAAVGTAIDLPAGTSVLPCPSCTVTAGFWNAHIHLTEPRWSLAAYKPAAALNAGLRDMLTSHGFTTVVDLGSNPGDTISVRRRIETGDLLGPFLYTAGSAQYPPHGIPFYLKNTLPPILLHFLDQPATPAAASSTAARNIREGADVLKLFTGALDTPHHVLPMPLANASAAVTVAHQHGQLVFAHPSDLEGSLIARDSGVDILAHAPSIARGVDRAFLQTIVDHRMSMVPTLKMFGTTVTTNPSFLDPIFAEVHTFHDLGGTLLFGTDVGYMTDYTTTDEFRYLAASGLSSTDILRMLTTAPAARFGVSAQKGRIAPGQLADLVLLETDPASDPAAFAHVLTTVRSGRVLFTRLALPATP